MFFTLASLSVKLTEDSHEGGRAGGSAGGAAGGLGAACNGHYNRTPDLGKRESGGTCGT